MKKYKLNNLDCASCANKIENSLSKLEGVKFVTVNFANATMTIDTDDIEKVKSKIKTIEPDVEIQDIEKDKTLVSVNELAENKGTIIKSTFKISKMDCPSEETLIRMKLEGLSMIKSLVFDIENRKLTVFHSEESSEIENHLKELNLGSQLQETIVVQADELKDDSSVQSVENEKLAGVANEVQQKLKMSFTMFKSTFKISKMDCPSEETLIRMKLEGLSMIKSLVFDIENRKLTVFHSEESSEIENHLKELNLGSQLQETIVVQADEFKDNSSVQSKLLWTVLIINFAFFIIEITTGFISKSMGLVADSLDMLADALVYGLSLWAVGSTVFRKKKVAKLSGYFQLALALIGLIEVIRRFISFEAAPDFKTMIIVSILALIANSVCLYLLQKSKSEEAHMKATMIFTSNDIIINTGVILAGILVLLTQSKYPDLIIGSIVFLIVVRGAFRILKLGK
jgi:Co/Zn/Cd efflux system component